MSVLSLNSKEEFDNFIKNNDTVLVDFWAAWCGPCKMIAPVVEKVSEELTNIRVCKVNVDELPDIAREYRVMHIPTLILFQNGEVAKTDAGIKTKDEIIDFVNSSAMR